MVLWLHLQSEYLSAFIGTDEKVKKRVQCNTRKYETVAIKQAGEGRCYYVIESIGK